MHDGHPSHIVLRDLHIRGQAHVVAGAFWIAFGLIIEPHVESAVESFVPSGVAVLSDHALRLDCSGKQLIHPTHHRPGIVPHR